MKITDMAKRDNINLDTISEIDYMKWYVESFFKNPETGHEWLKRFDFDFLKSNNAIRETFNSVCSDAVDSFHCYILPRRHRATKFTE